MELGNFHTLVCEVDEQVRQNKKKRMALLPLKFFSFPFTCRLVKATDKLKTAVLGLAGQPPSPSINYSSNLKQYIYFYLL